MGSGPSAIPKDQHVVVVGAGYGGSQMARELQKGKCSFSLIDPQEFMHHCVASVRSVVNTDYATKCCIPLKQVFGKNFVQGKVVKVDTEKKCVELEDGKVIEYNTLVLATGSRSFMPFKSDGIVTTIKEYVEKASQVKAEVDKADSVVVIGGGAVGTEVAAEIAETYPDKKVTVIHNKADMVAPGYSEAFYERAAECMTELNINYVKSETVSNLDDLRYGVLGEYVVKTDQGNEFSAQLVFRTTGLTLNSAAYESTLPVDDKRRLKVDDHLRVEGQEDIYAIGDICGTEDPNLAYVAREQAQLVYANLTATTSEQPTKPWAQNDLPMKIALAVGSQRAIGLTATGDLAPEPHIVGFKSRDLMSGMIWEAMGMKSP